jgi:hypothetical protein
MTINAVVLVSLFMIVPLGLIGSVLHFLFDWTKHKRFVAFFSAVNESYWEHIKIAIWPVLLLQVVLFPLVVTNTSPLFPLPRLPCIRYR